MCGPWRPLCRIYEGGGGHPDDAGRVYGRASCHVHAPGLFAQDLRASPKRGEALYRLHCVKCHGEAGNGMGPEARALIVPPASFHLGKYRSKTDSELLIAIEDGVLFSPMHAWRHTLTKEQVRDLIGYIRFFAPVVTGS